MSKTEVLVKEYKKQLPVRLLLEENAEYSRDLVRLMKDHQDLESKAKAAAASFRERLKEMKGRISHTRDVLDSGEVERDIRVQEFHDPMKRVARTVRMDTGQEIESRELTEAELTAVRQGQLKLAEVRQIQESKPAT